MVVIVVVVAVGVVCVCVYLCVYSKIFLPGSQTTKYLFSLLLLLMFACFVDSR